jgi:hypothetical protein
VSEAVRGELWKITLCNNGTEYCSVIHITEGIHQFGGLQITPDGKTLYAGVTFEDKSHGIISTSTTYDNQHFEVVAMTKHQPNGFACDWKRNMMYYTDEGTGSEEGGSVTSFNLLTGEQIVVKDHIPGADGAWFDAATDKLYIGELISMKINVFDTSKDVISFVGNYIGLNEMRGIHMIDDITLFSTSPDGDISKSVLLAADFTGKAIQMFQLDGSSISTVTPSIELYEPTSVRWGYGPGFDSNSIYLTEGGGATARQTSRRVVQIRMK